MQAAGDRKDHKRYHCLQWWWPKAEQGSTVFGFTPDPRAFCIRTLLHKQLNNTENRDQILNLSAASCSVQHLLVSHLSCPVTRGDEISFSLERLGQRGLKFLKVSKAPGEVLVTTLLRKGMTAKLPPILKEWRHSLIENSPFEQLKKGWMCTLNPRELECFCSTERQDLKQTLLFHSLPLLQVYQSLWWS